MCRIAKTGQSLVEMVLVLSVTAAVFSAMMLYLRRDFNAKYRQGIKYVFSELGKQAEKQAQEKNEILQPFGPQDDPDICQGQFKQHQYETNFQEKETVEDIVKNVRTGGSSGSSMSMEIKNSGWTTMGPDGD